MAEPALWQWAFGVLYALIIGVAKTGVPGVGMLSVPLMVAMVGDARFAAAWALPILLVGDVFAVAYWRRHADVRRLFSLVPWVAVGMVAGGLALSLSEPILRRTLGVVVVVMLAVNLYRRRHPGSGVGGHPALYGVPAGFATTIANSAGPVMHLYLLQRRLPKEQFVATGAWFFLVVNLAKVPIYWWYGLFSRASLSFDLAMTPAVLTGAVVGLWAIKRIPQAVFEGLILALTALASLYLFV